MRAVATELGNTAAVARASYVDPRVVTAFEAGRTIRPIDSWPEINVRVERRAVLDQEVVDLIASVEERAAS